MAGFFLRNPGTCFFLVVGALMNIGSRLNDAYTFVNAGLPHQVYEAVGAAIFFITIVVLLYRWDKERQTTTAKAAYSTAELAEIAKRRPVSGLDVVRRLERLESNNNPTDPATKGSKAPSARDDPLKRTLTAYDVEQRLRAIDSLLELLDPKIMTVSAEGERLRPAIFGKIADGTAVQSLDQFADSLEAVLREYYVAASRYTKFAEIYQAATSSEWPIDRIPNTTRLLRAEIQDMNARGQLNVKPEFIADIFRNNQLMADFQEVGSGKIWTWINDRKNALIAKRREYETAEVYPK